MLNHKGRDTFVSFSTSYLMYQFDQDSHLAPDAGWGCDRIRGCYVTSLVLRVFLPSMTRNPRLQSPDPDIVVRVEG